MKKLSIITLFAFVFACSSCGEGYSVDGGYDHPDFETQYTEEEHVQRIMEKTKELFSEEFSRGVIKSCNVEIVYAFYDNDPEYFLVEIEYKETFTWSLQSLVDDNPIQEVDTKYKHFLGYILLDSYYSTRDYSYGFKGGRSSWNYLGYTKNKKYYGKSVQGIEIDGQIVQICQTIGGWNSVEFISAEYGYVEKETSEQFFWKGQLSEKEQERNMRANYDMFRVNYEELLEGKLTEQ